MSFLLKVCTEEEKLTVYHKRFAPSPVYFGNNQHSIMIGEVFGEATEEEVLNSGWEEKPEVLNGYKTTVSMISYCASKCYFYSDIMGTETVYYYWNEERKMLCLSDDFWDIVQEIAPSQEDINLENLALRLSIGGNLLSDETIVTGIKYLLPGTMAVYDRTMGVLNIKKKYFAFFSQKNRKDQVIENIDAALNEAMQDIKKKFSEDTIYGIGLSGGLDSRVILHYAVKNGLKCVCFNCCMEKPYNLFRARSVRMAEKIAKIYDVPFKIVEWNINELEHILHDKIRYYPNGSLLEGATDLFKMNYGRIPNFDVLIGGSGLGSQFFCGLYPKTDFTSEEKLTEYILKEYLWSFNNNLLQKVKKVIFFFLGRGKGDKCKKIRYKFSWLKNLYETPRSIIVNRIHHVIREVKECNPECEFLEILLNFRVVMTAGNGIRFGAFQSRFGNSRSYCIYDPWIVKESLNGDAELLKTRSVLRELICSKMLEISMVGEEAYAPAPGKKGNMLQMRMAKLLAILDRLITGDGSHIAKRYWKSQEVKESFWKDYNNECVWFKNILKEERIDIHEKDIFRTNHYTMLNIWDTKRLIDAIERKSF